RVTHGIGVSPRREHPLALLAPDAYLLRDVVVSHARRLPAIGPREHIRFPAGVALPYQAQPDQREPRLVRGDDRHPVDHQRGHSPPVAITVTAPGSSGDSSTAIRRAIPSTCPANPYTIPDCSASTVFLPITLGGLVNSTLSSCAARRDSASTEISIPGAIAPPTNSPRALTASKLVEVPKSTTIAAPPYRCTAASEFMIRSLPTSLGLSLRIGTPVRTPGSTITASTSA